MFGSLRVNFGFQTNRLSCVRPNAGGKTSAATKKVNLMRVKTEAAVTTEGIFLLGTSDHSRAENVLKYPPRRYDRARDRDGAPWPAGVNHMAHCSPAARAAPVNAWKIMSSSSKSSPMRNAAAVDLKQSIGVLRTIAEKSDRARACPHLIASASERYWRQPKSIKKGASPRRGQTEPSCHIPREGWRDATATAYDSANELFILDVMHEDHHRRFDLNLLASSTPLMRERHAGRAGERLWIDSAGDKPRARTHARLVGDPLFVKYARG